MLNTKFKDSHKNAVEKVATTLKHRFVQSNEYREFIKDEIS